MFRRNKVGEIDGVKMEGQTFPVRAHSNLNYLLKEREIRKEEPDLDSEERICIHEGKVQKNNPELDELIRSEHEYRKENPDWDKKIEDK